MLQLPSSADVALAAGYLKNLLRPTPVVEIGNVLAKLESLQPTGSFKVRAAAVCLQSSEADALWTASAGNMGAAVAWMASRAGVQAHVVVPNAAPDAKTRRIEAFGAQVERVPYADWWALLGQSTESRPGRFVHPFADPEVLAANGTVAMEVLSQVPDVDAVVVPFGGGGLLCGIGAVLRALAPQAVLYAAEVDAAAPLAASFEAGGPATVQRELTFVDGIGAASVQSEMWPLLQDLSPRPIAVGIRAVREAIGRAAATNSIILEGAAGAALAVAEQVADRHRRVVAIASGGNIDNHVLADILIADG